MDAINAPWTLTRRASQRRRSGFFEKLHFPDSPPVHTQALNFWGLSPAIDVGGLCAAAATGAESGASAPPEGAQKTEELKILQARYCGSKKFHHICYNRSEGLAVPAAAQRSGVAQPHFTALTCTQVSPSDCRHTIMTIARAARHERRNVRVYVFQTHMEELARHLLLVSIFLDEEQAVKGEWVWLWYTLGSHRRLRSFTLWTDDELLRPVADRVETFLEVFGNSKVRDKTAEYITDRSKLLADIVLGDGHKSSAGTPKEFARCGRFSRWCEQR